MLLCPYIKHVNIKESTTYNKFPAEGPDTQKTRHITTSFGECVQSCCPFYWQLTKTCRRAESEAK